MDLLMDIIMAVGQGMILLGLFIGLRSAKTEKEVNKMKIMIGIFLVFFIVWWLYRFGNLVF